MRQFDSPTEAALARLKSENLSSSPVDGKVEKIANLGGIILDSIGFTGSSVPVKLFSILKSLAANKDEGNLAYFADALIDDIRRLYRLHEELKKQFDERINSPEFNAAVANATLHITRTNVETRLKRLTHLISNGVKGNDLETESLDDMMRAAVELKDYDLHVLNTLLNQQQKTADRTTGKVDGIINKPIDVWSALNQSGFYTAENYMVILTSLERLKSVGFCAEIQTMAPSWLPRVMATPLGEAFLKRIHEIND
jgi:hypothetical protein